MNTVIFYNDDGDVVRWVITPDESSAETPPGLNRLVLNYELDDPTAWIVQGGALVENPSPGIVISADQVLLEGNQIRLTGDTVVDGSFTVTGPMIAPGALIAVESATLTTTVNSAETKDVSFTGLSVSMPNRALHGALVTTLFYSASGATQQWYWATIRLYTPAFGGIKNYIGQPLHVMILDNGRPQTFGLPFVLANSPASFSSFVLEIEHGPAGGRKLIVDAVLDMELSRK